MAHGKSGKKENYTEWWKTTDSSVAVLSGDAFNDVLLFSSFRFFCVLIIRKVGTRKELKKKGKLHSIVKDDGLESGSTVE